MTEVGAELVVFAAAIAGVKRLSGMQIEEKCNPCDNFYFLGVLSFTSWGREVWWDNFHFQEMRIALK